jgi:hypothetical protein
MGQVEDIDIGQRDRREHVLWMLGIGGRDSALRRWAQRFASLDPLDDSDDIKQGRALSLDPTDKSILVDNPPPAPHQDRTLTRPLLEKGPSQSIGRPYSAHVVRISETSSGALLQLAQLLL